MGGYHVIVVGEATGRQDYPAPRAYCHLRAVLLGEDPDHAPGRIGDQSLYAHVVLGPHPKGCGLHSQRLHQHVAAAADTALLDGMGGWGLAHM